MGKTMKKRIIPVLLAAAMLFSLLGAPAAAAFPDITDPKVAEAVGTLAEMGMIGGFPDGTYRPEETLTRAQFCKIAICMMDARELTKQYAGYTIFADVLHTHWAAEFINTAARHSFDGENSGIIGGFPDGSFRPDEVITDAQALTIALRILGYRDGDVGPLWPGSYLEKAASIGITDGLVISADQPITRGRAAILFANLLDAEVKGGGKTLMEKLGYSYLEDVILLAIPETDDTLKKGEVRCLKDGMPVVCKATAELAATLVGRRGKLSLDEDQKVIGFAADAVRAETVVVGAARVDGITSASDAFTYIPAKTPIINTDGQSRLYSESWTAIKSGSEYVIYYDERGNIDYMMEAKPGEDGTLAILKSDGSGVHNPLKEAFPAAGGYQRIIKNGSEATVADLRKYDVASYNERTGTFVVSDRKFTGPIGDADPALLSAESVTIYGVKFDVAAGCERVLKDFKIGDRVTLLLTGEGKVAGAAPAENVAASEYALVKSVSGSDITVEFAGGYETTLTTDNDYSERLTTGLVTVRPARNNTVAVIDVKFSNSLYGAYNVRANTVGGKPVAAGVLIYERAAAGARLREVKKENIQIAEIPANEVWFVGCDSTGAANLIVVGNVIGDAYTYGKVRVTTEQVPVAVDGGTLGGYIRYEERYFYELTGPEPSKVPSRWKMSASCADGFGGLCYSFLTGEAVAMIGTIRLGTTDLSGFSGTEYITVAGTPVKLTDDTLYYFEDSGTYGTIEKAKNFGTSFTVYVEKSPASGGKARVISVK